MATTKQLVYFGLSVLLVGATFIVMLANNPTTYFEHAVTALFGAGMLIGLVLLYYTAFDHPPLWEARP